MTHKLSTLAFLPLISLSLLTLASCNPTSDQSENTKIETAVTSAVPATTQADSLINNQPTEDKITDTILKLAEIMERAKYIDDQTKGERHLKAWVEDSPHLPEQKYYWIKVGEDNDAELVAHFNFFVYPDSMRIMYYDILSDSELTLEQWRKTNGMQP